MWLKFCFFQDSTKIMTDSFTHILMLHCPPHQHCVHICVEVFTACITAKHQRCQTITPLPFSQSAFLLCDVTRPFYSNCHYSHQSLTNGFRWYMTCQADRPCMQIWASGRRADALISVTPQWRAIWEKNICFVDQMSMFFTLWNNSCKPVAHEHILITFYKDNTTFSNQWMVS